MLNLNSHNVKEKKKNEGFFNSIQEKFERYFATFNDI